LALPTGIKGFDPAQSNDVPTTKVLGALYEALLQYDYLSKPLRVIPDLAVAMPTVSADGLTYTFKLRKDVRYHQDACFQGQPRFLQAQDFVYAFQRVADVKTLSGGWWVLDGWIQGLNAWRKAGADYSQPVVGLQAPTPHTFVIHLTRPYPQFLYMMTMVFAAPVPQEAVDFYGKELVRHAVGTGPFRLRSYHPKSRIELERNPDYREVHYPTEGPDWARKRGLLTDAGKRLPLVDEIIYKITPEPQPAWLDFLSGGLEISPIPKDSFRTALLGGLKLAPDLAAREIQLEIQESQTLWWIGMNMADPAFRGEAGKHLRKAIAYAHNAPRFVKLLFAGQGRPHPVPLPAQLPSYDAKAWKGSYSFDPARAQEELRLAGYPEGRGAPPLRLDIRDASSSSRQACEYLAGELEKIGLQVKVEGNTYMHYLRKAKQGQLQLYLGRWVGDYPDEENWTQLLYGPNSAPGTNFSNYKNPTYDALHLKARRMTDGLERRKLVQQMMNIVLADCPWRVSFQQSRFILHQSWLHNLRSRDEIYNGHKYLRVENH
jgi:ABC-type transport system substrate-binding protein